MKQSLISLYPSRTFPKKEQGSAALERYKQKFVNSLMVMCTYKCQFICDYCEVRQSNLEMPLKVLHKAIDLLLTTKSQECQLRFWGGEPLLRWNLIKDGIRFGKKKADKAGKKIKFMITTNGLLLDKEKLAFLRKHRVEIMFSLDGDNITNELHRISKGFKKNYEKILENLKLLRDSGLDYFVNMVVTPASVESLFKNLYFMKRSGINNVQLCYRNGILWPKGKVNSLLSEIRRFIKKDNSHNFLMNFFNDCEPTSLSQEVLVDIDGSLYFDAAIFLEKKYPELRNSYFLGKVNEIREIDCLHRSKWELYHIFKNSCSKEQENVLLNNINLGLQLDNFLNGISIASLNSNEHPLFISFVKANFYLQKKLIKGFNIKSFFLHLNGPCLNNCLFCKSKRDSHSDLFKVEQKLKDNLRLKFGRLCIIGNEPLLHPDIMKILDLSKNYGFKNIETMTSGECLCDRAFAEKIIERGVSSFSLPLFAKDEKVHDFIVGRRGSFMQTIIGIKHALYFNANVFIHSNLIKQNMDHIKALEHYVTKELMLPFVILPIRPKTANLTFGELMPAYGEIIEKLKGVTSLLGFPLCVVKKVQSNLFKTARDISDSMKIYFLDQNFSKIQVCADCKYYSNCSGLFKEYGNYYSLNEIEPFKN